MKLLITDTNVFIDILRLNKCSDFFALNQEIHTTQFVIFELDDNQKEVLKSFEDNNQLKIREFNDEEVSDIISLNVSRKSVSKRIADRSMIYLAECEGGVLISGDKSLKNEAEDKGLKVHGTIWVICQMYEQQIINASELIQTLDDLKISNPFLPKEEINLIIKEMKKV